MPVSETYNGWTNWETWESYGWLTVDEMFGDLAAKHRNNPAALKELVRDARGAYGVEVDGAINFDKVNWDEIKEHLEEE